MIFRRSELTHPLVQPERGGTLDGLRELINLPEEDYRLAIGWVVAAYLTGIPHPILLVQGEQGTAKSEPDPDPAGPGRPAAGRRPDPAQRPAGMGHLRPRVVGVQLRQHHRHPALAVQRPVQRRHRRRRPATGAALR